MRERKALLIRIDPALHQALEEWAEQDMRSLNGQIEFLLKQAVLKRRRSLESKLEGSSDDKE